MGHAPKGFRRRSHALFVGVAIVVAAALLSCSGGADPTSCDGNLCASLIQVEPPNPTLTVGGSLALEATVLNKLGPIQNPDVSWSSDASSIVSITGAGANVMATAKAPGTTVVHATSGGATGGITITVSQIPVVRISASQDTVTVAVGANQQLAATVYDGSGGALSNRPVAWTSLNTAVATVGTYTGVVTGVSVGSAKVVGTSETKTDTVVVTVIPVPIATVAITPGSVDVAVGANVPLTATPRDAAGNTLSGRATPTWSSADQTIATVSGAGVVTGVAIGSTNVTATIEGTSATVPVKVSPVQYTIGLTASPAAGGTVSGGGKLPAGTTTTVTATAITPYSFVNWTENGTVVSASAIYQFTVTGDRNLVANFAQTPPVQLTVSGAGNGAGTVTATSPGGISCNISSGNASGTCLSAYPVGTQVTLKATAATGGHTFGGWSGDCSASGTQATCVLTMSQARSVTASFIAPQSPAIALSQPSLSFSGYVNGPMPLQTVVVTNSGPGTLTGLTPTVSYAQGQPTGWLTTARFGSGTTAPAVLSVQPTVSAGLAIGTYSATISISSPVAANSPQTVAVTLNVIATPSFSLSVAGAGDGTGSVTSSVGGINCTSTAGAATGTCTATILGGTTATLTANAATGSLFQSWSGTCNATSTTCQVLMNQNSQVTATFVKAPSNCVITTAALPSAAGSTSGGGTFPCGTSVTVHAVPAAGYTFNNWTEGINVVSMTADYTFTPVTSRNLAANFVSGPVIQIAPNLFQPFSLQGATPKQLTAFSTITNAGGGQLTGLSIGSITYAPGQLSGWISNPSLSSTTAPSNISLTVSAANLPENIYTADIQIVSSVPGVQPATLRIEFEVDVTQPFTIVSTFVSPSAGGTVTGGGKYITGNPVTLTASPAPGYKFVNFTSGSTVLSTSATYKFNAGANIDITANFALIGSN